MSGPWEHKAEGSVFYRLHGGNRHLEIYCPRNIKWKDGDQFSQRKSGSIYKRKNLCLVAAKKKKKEKESYQQQPVCIFVCWLFNNIFKVIWYYKDNPRAHKISPAKKYNLWYTFTTLDIPNCCALDRKGFQCVCYTCTQNKNVQAFDSWTNPHKVSRWFSFLSSLI